jgi:hypothetical protein
VPYVLLAFTKPCTDKMAGAWNCDPTCNYGSSTWRLCFTLAAILASVVFVQNCVHRCWEKQKTSPEANFPLMQDRNMAVMRKVLCFQLVATTIESLESDGCDC